MGKTKIIENNKLVNLSSKNENNTVYLEKVTVSHTKQFFGNTMPETKKIATLKVIVPGRLEAHGF